MIAFIWAEDLDGGIGIDGHLPWHISEDLKYFKDQTINHPIIMGQKTFSSLPGILPQRQHIILSHTIKLIDDANVIIMRNKQKLDNWLLQHNDELCFIIGGATLFEMYREQVRLLYRTIIDDHYLTDVKMPELDYSKFTIIQKQTLRNATPKCKVYVHQRK